MSLLELERVGKRSCGGERVALHDVSLVVEPGEMVTVWGERRSGRSTLLLVASGIEAPDTGAVRFQGADLVDRRNETLGRGIAYCRTELRSFAGKSVVDQLAAGLLARGTTRSRAHDGAWEALQRVDAKHLASRRPRELDNQETVRVAIARALTSQPQLLVIDEPTIGVDLLARDSILELLRSIADDGVAVLSTTGDGTGALGADRVLSLSNGELIGETRPELAQVTDISQLRRASA